MCQLTRFLAFIVSVSMMSVASDRENASHVRATAVLYRGAGGEALLVTGTLAPATRALITRDLRARTQLPLHVTVVPAYKNIYEVPIHKNLLNHLKVSFSNLYILNLTPEESTQVMRNIEKRVYMYNKRVSYMYEKNMRGKIKRRENNDTLVEELSDMASELSTTQAPNHSYADNFVPNDIYYAVEKRCANWAAGCEASVGSFLDLPAKFVIHKHNYKIPFKFQWIP